MRTLPGRAHVSTRVTTRHIGCGRRRAKKEAPAGRRRVADAERLDPDGVVARLDASDLDVDEGDVDAQRFYERQGFSGVEPTTGERAFCYFRELDPG